VSLILTWENPTDLVFGKAHSAMLYRGDIRVQTDIAWGTAEDTETSEPTDRYEVVYFDRAGSFAARVADEEIRRYVRPPKACRITFAFTRPDGSPDGGRLIEFRGDDFSRRLLTNTKGHALIYLMPGARMWIRVDGRSLALDCMVPDRREMTYDALVACGSMIDADRRGWY